MITQLTEPIFTHKIGEYVLFKLGIVGLPSAFNEINSDRVKMIDITYLCLHTGETKKRCLSVSQYLIYQQEYIRAVLEAPSYLF